MGAYILVNYIVEFLQYAGNQRKADVKSHTFIDPLELAEHLRKIFDEALNVFDYIKVLGVDLDGKFCLPNGFVYRTTGSNTGVEIEEDKIRGRGFSIAGIERVESFCESERHS